MKNSRVDLHLFEMAAATMARPVLHHRCARSIGQPWPDASNPSEVAVPEIGDEVPAARALRRLADRLLGVASDDIKAIEGHEVHLRP